MTDVGKTIKQKRIEKKLTQAEIATAVGVSEATVSRWESGLIANIGSTKIAALAKALEISPGVIAGWRNEVTVLPANALPVQRRKVPLLGSIAAGQPIYVEQGIDDYTTCDEDTECDFALQVDGDSMEPRLHTGDVVFIRSQDDVLDGQIGAVLIDDSATLKHVYHISGGLQLISDNPAYRPMTFTSANSDTLRVLGLAVAYKRKLV